MKSTIRTTTTNSSRSRRSGKFIVLPFRHASRRTGCEQVANALRSAAACLRRRIHCVRTILTWSRTVIRNYTSPASSTNGISEWHNSGFWMVNELRSRSRPCGLLTTLAISLSTIIVTLFILHSYSNVSLSLFYHYSAVPLLSVKK